MKRLGIDIAQNQPRFGIWAGDLRSRIMHVDLHVELHVIKNSRPADSAPYFTRLAQFSFNWLAPLRKISKVVDPCDAEGLFGGPLLGDVEVGWTRKRKGRGIAVACEGFSEGGSGAVVLVEYLALVDTHDPVESKYEE